MKAAVHRSYGPPEVVRVEEVAKPAAEDGQVLGGGPAAQASWRQRDRGLRARQGRAGQRAWRRQGHRLHGWGGLHQGQQIYDAVLDAVGKSSFGRCRRLLKPRGVYLSSDLGPLSQNPILALVTPLFGGRKVRFPIPRQRDRAMVMSRRTGTSRRARRSAVS
jgi:NADPH:quinone reductase-like Zn-dependent oxidoreductase